MAGRAHDVLLVGCGAEIGSLLLGMNDPARDGIAISAVVTNPIADQSRHPHLHPLHSLYARLVLADPRLVDEVSVDLAHGRLVIRGRPIDVLWGDAATVSLDTLGRSFAACVVATSKAHIANRAFMERFLSVSRFVAGVAEASNLPALYPSLVGAPDRLLGNPSRPLGDARVVAFGSCQTNGWQAQLRGLLEAAVRGGCASFDIVGAELDIVHPDTPQGRLGTKSIDPRSQDPRNNLRPSFSQVETAMRRLFPGRHGINTISLRTLTMPPGYQIARFFFRYERPDTRRFTTQEFAESFADTARAMPSTLRVTDTPLGSRAYEMVESAAVVLAGKRYLRYSDNPFAMAGPPSARVAELITQAYVHNTRGYCRSVLNVIRHLVTTTAPKAFFPAA
ncbi:MAG: hypothetical protein A3I61_19990 [Acidobacteria bacterium RIFCSPLOWO2_02_FULL_68_18]|nr:MAG: hypothetical protein A3I61_19990 [Acidobacteria bacterium RIFCSPLOWO2_02_FULL_68_18]